MAYSLWPSNPNPIDLTEFTARMKDVSLSCAEDALEVAEIFASLNANRSLLPDFLNAKLLKWRDSDYGSGYTGQSFILSMTPSYFIRANVWMPRSYAYNPTAAQNEQFFYSLAHDHNFSFMTAGHHGAGYRTELYEYDGLGGTPRIGERVELRFLETTTLPAGKVMIYRASQDVHIQHEPDEFSISLNLITRNAKEADRIQCLFEAPTGEVTAHPKLQLATTESLIQIATFIGDSRTETLLHDLSESHPSAVVRGGARDAWTSLVEA